MHGALVCPPAPWEDGCPARYAWKSRGGSHRRHPPPIVPVEPDLMVGTTNDMNRYTDDGSPKEWMPDEAKRRVMARMSGLPPPVEGCVVPHPPDWPYGEPGMLAADDPRRYEPPWDNRDEEKAKAYYATLPQMPEKNKPFNPQMIGPGGVR